MALPPRAFDELRGRFGERLRTDPEEIAPYRTDASHLRGAVEAVVRPSDADEVQALVRWARTHRIALVARGAGTPLDGESVPWSGVVVDLSGWSAILEIDPVDRIARVGPGTVNHDLQVAAREHGLFFPPNPGSWRSSTVGGNVATNASGPRLVPLRAHPRVGAGGGGRPRYRRAGPRRVPSAETIDRERSRSSCSWGARGPWASSPRSPSRCHRSRTGAPRSVSPCPITFRSARSWPGSVGRSRMGSPPSSTSIDAARRRSSRVPGSRLPGDAALLLLEVESSSEAEETERLGRLGRRLGTLGVREAPVVFPDADRLWSLRGESGTALDRAMGERVREDVCVPIARLDELLALIARTGSEAGVATCVYGHLGEASLHPNFAIDPTTAAATRLAEEFLRGVLRLGGVVSGEHGIGAVKRGLWDEQVGRAGARLLRTIKQACDPGRDPQPVEALRGRRGSCRRRRSAFSVARGRGFRSNSAGVSQRADGGRCAGRAPRRRPRKTWIVTEKWL